MSGATLARTTFAALGTTVQLTTAGITATAATTATASVEHRHALALDAVRAELVEIDVACSRFRADSDLSRVNAGAGGWVDVGRPFLRALRVALDAAASSRGAVDPTIGAALRVLGYDRDFAAVGRTGPPVLHVGAVPGWQVIDIDVANSRARVPAGVRIDLGATAKGLAADRAAVRASRACGGGVLLSLGGDIAVAGEAPPEGWVVGVADSHRTAFADADQAVVLWTGGLATSSVTVRSWRRGDETHHHVIDPSTGRSTTGPWRTVTVAALSCVAANVSSTAAIVLGDDAAPWLVERGHAARLVPVSGPVQRLNGWPEDDG